ncbi:MAG TPA: ferrochelatase [Acidobacteriaceae bacterium]
MKEAILLLAHGTPDVLGEMAEYLSRVTAGRPMPPAVIEELQHRYAEIGLRNAPLPEGPPLTRWTLRQAELLAAQTSRPVYVGMRNWHPYIADTVARMKSDGITHARILCLAPQNSRTSTGLYKRALDAALDNAFTYDFIAGWSHEPLLADAFAEKLKPILTEANTALNTQVPVLFTAHSVPCRTIRPATPEQAAEGSGPQPGAAPSADDLQNYGAADAGDPYPIECKQTAAAVAAALDIPEDAWFFAFQSQGIAGAPWLGPTVEDTLKALAAEGHKAVVMQPIGFLCDHVEILYDIDISFRATAAALGLTLYRAPSLNDSPTLINAIQHVLRQGT